MAAPLCRNRTDQFLAKRRLVRGPNAGKPKPFPPLCEGDVEMGVTGASLGRLPEWVDALEEVRELEGQLKESLMRLGKLHQKRLVPSSMFSEEDDSSVQIQLQAAQISAQFKKSDLAVKRLTAMADATKTGDEKTTITNVQISLATQLSDLQKEFRDMQKRFLQAEKERRRKSLFQPSEATRQWEQEDAQLVQDEEHANLNMTQDQIEMTRLKNEMLNQRDSELQDIVKSLMDIQEMFQDLNMMVIDQGTMLDRIDHNVNKAHDSVTEGLGHLKAADEKSKNTKFKSCVCFLLVMITFFLLALIASPSHGHAPGPGPGPVPVPPSTPVPTHAAATPAPA
eukprot:Rhum_TRINITY_DN2328_c0_g1::Rhum_TRINITY_DN2328_c0_g1_i1::g.6721::m.6721/K08489/STX16; syntaxin 16